MDDCLDTPLDVLASLRHALLARRGVVCQFTEGRTTIDDKSLSDKIKDILGVIDKRDIK